MPRPGWYNDNQFRQYPFISDRGLSLGSDSSLGELQLPEDAITDFGCVTGLDAGFVEGRDKVWLHEIRRVGSEFEFDFRSDAPGLIGQYALIFTRTIGDPEFAVEHVTAVPLTSISVSCPIPCPGDEIWEGFMVHGKLDGLLDILEAGDTLFGDDFQTEIEPALVQSLTDSFVRAVSLGSFARTRGGVPTQCESSSLSSVPSPDFFINGRCLQGDLKVIEGYNCAITQNDLTSTIIINAGRGAGAGVPCDEVPNDGEVPPDGGDLLTGGAACGDVVKTINGIGGTIVRLKAGTGVRVFPHETDPNTVVVDVDHHDQAICAPEEQSSLSSAP